MVIQWIFFKLKWYNWKRCANASHEASEDDAHDSPSQYFLIQIDLTSYKTYPDSQNINFFDIDSSQISLPVFCKNQQFTKSI